VAPDLALMDAIDAGVCVADFESGEILYANAPFRRGFGESAKLLSEAERCFSVPPSQRFAPAQLVETGGTTEAVLEDEFLCDVSQQWYLVRARAVAWPGRDWVRLHTYCNITSRAESERFLQAQQEKLLLTSKLMSVGEMASTLSHELNQPIGAIVNYVSGCLRRIQQGRCTTNDLVEPLEAARLQAAHAGQVIGRVRDFVRTREPRKEPHAVPAIVDGVLRLLELESSKQRVRIDVDIAPQLPEFVGDGVMIEQVVLNLVKNAIEAMRDTPPERRRVRIQSAVNADGQIEVRVRDQGPGLSSKNGEQLFSPFFTTKPDGMGIGLNICRSIVEYHGGRLTFSNQADGGCLFAFTLPPGRAAA
jgi:C4-dicarboxylate-specific signal transduction histidine kinase